MSKFLIASTTVISLVLGMNMALADAAHHANTATEKVEGDMMPANPMREGMMRNGMMGGGMMMNPEMMLVMLDADGDGALSLKEFQDMHARMFNYLDENNDGKLDPAEIGAHHAGGMLSSDDATNE